MKRIVYLADAAGFCFGVKKAIEKAESMDKAFIYGSLIHNPQEVERLAAEGKRIVKSLDEVEGRQVVITAHGLDLPTLEDMRSRGYELVDTTCPLVTRIYQEGTKLEEKGLRIIILGDPKHVEVKGIASRMKDPIIVYKAEDVAQVPEGSKVGIICQSTLLLEKFDRFVALLKERCAEVVAVNTVCKPTKDRQTAAANLAREVDVMIVIGGRNSSNTHKLADTCADILPNDTHHIETADELKKEWFEGKGKVGVTAGASTPDYLIQPVLVTIKSYDE
jgi:(E)-4-hydroxy-3-methyl-but-2-enyl pyrophosphate reductase